MNFCDTLSPWKMRLQQAKYLDAKKLRRLRTFSQLHAEMY